MPSKYIFCLGIIICNFQYNSNCKNVIVACSLDKLVIRETSNSSTVDITADLGEYSYYSDIIVTLTSRKFNGSFQLEYLSKIPNDVLENFLLAILLGQISITIQNLF